MQSNQNFVFFIIASVLFYTLHSATESPKKIKLIQPRKNDHPDKIVTEKNFKQMVWQVIFWSTKKILRSFNWKKRVPLLLDNQHTCTCTHNITRSLPISVHNAVNMRECRGLALTKNSLHWLKHPSSWKAFPWQREPLGGCCSVPTEHREQLLALTLSLRYVLLSWPLCHLLRK